MSLNDNEKALQFYNFSLKKEFEKSPQRSEVEKKIEQLNNR